MRTVPRGRHPYNPPPIMAKHSETLFQRAQDVIPGGVNSPVRAFRGVGGSPLFIETAQGARIFDVDNLQYIDCVGSWPVRASQRSKISR